MTVQADRQQIAGGFVGGGSDTRDHVVHFPQAVRVLSALVPRTTPARVRSGLIAVILLAACLATALPVVASGVDGAFQAMGQRTEPEVTAATGLYLSLTDMDSQLSNVLLVGGDKTLGPDRAADLATWASDRAAADSDLQQAAVTAAGSPAAQRELRAVLNGVGQYEALTADAILADQQASPSAGPAPTAVLAYYRQATDLMKNSILPQVSALISTNSSELNAAYETGLSRAGAGIGVSVGLGLALAAALVAFQGYLAARFRRRINPPLVAATLLVLAVTGFAWSTFASEQSSLRTARFSSFSSIIALSQSRAVGYDANADESRYLVFPARHDQYQQDFLKDAQAMASVGNTTLAGYPAALNRDVAVYRFGGRVLFGGFLGTEFRNFTFPGERQAGLRALLTWQAYVDDDHHLRTLAGGGMARAVAYDSGTAPDESDGSFNRFASALTAVIAVDQRGFATAVADGEGSAGQSWDLIVVLALTLGLAGLAYLGVRPRLAEYRTRP